MSTFNDMVDFLDAAWMARDTIVPCLIGGAGIGKTAAVRQHVANVGAGKVVTIIASQILPNEVSGITMPVDKTHSMEIYDHYRLSSLEDGDVLFFDELLEADQLVLSACLTLIESRQMMSGKLLPDIQIVAATNPTIKPSMLKENIRQRFLFRSFGIDKTGTHDYILSEYGIDVKDELLDKMTVNGEDYNILSPRSLTKMAAWISHAKDKTDARKIADHISLSWGSAIGASLYNSWTKKRNKRTILNSLCAVLDDDQYRVLTALKRNEDEGENLDIWDTKLSDDDVSIEKIMDIITKLPDWEEVQRKLNNIEVADDMIDRSIEF